MNKIYYKIRHEYAAERYSKIRLVPKTKQAGIPQSAQNYNGGGWLLTKTKYSRLTTLLKALEADGIPYTMSHEEEYTLITT